MSQFFIRRPIVAMVISIFMVIAGLLVLQGIPVSQYPDITPPAIKITGLYSGASAIDVEKSVATPIEQQVNGVENMLYMQSVNANDGSTTIQVTFEVGTDLDKANMLTQNRVAMANPMLPVDVRNIGISTKKALSFPLAMVSVYSPGGSWSREFVNNYNYIHIVDRIKRIKGVGDVNVFGGTEYAMRVWLKPDRMASLGVTVSDIRSAMNDFNAIAPGGSFGSTPSLAGTQNTYTALLQARLVSAEEFGKIICKSGANGAQVRLSDVARIGLGAENYSVTSRFNGSNASTLSIYQVPGSNALAVVEEVRRTMDELKSSFPPDLDYRFSLDTTLAVRAGIEEIVQTLLEAILLVILVVFIFLQDWRATLIPLITVPVSLIGTFLFFPLLGFSVNVLSLLGMVLAIGLVVDDAIVVVEAVMFHIEEGLSPREATQKAMREVAGPVMTIAIVLSAVFIPVAMTGGITGRLYQQFAITIAISVLLSAFNALTLTPALAAMILRPKKAGARSNRFFAAFNSRFEKITFGYIRVAGFFTRKLIISVLLLVVILAGAGLSGRKVPTGFVPEEDAGYFLVGVMLPDAASFERADSVSHKLEHLLSGIDGVGSVTSINGYNLFSGTVSPNCATMFVQLKDWDKRSLSLQEVTLKVNGLVMMHLSEATAFAVQPPPIPGLGSSAGFTLELQDQSGGSPLYLAQQSRRFIEAAQHRPEIGNIYTLYRPSVPQKSIRVDKEKVEKLGLSLSDVNASISALLGGAFVNNFNQFGRQYKTYIQADASYRMKPDDLNQFFVRDGKGNMVPLSTLVTVTDTSGPLYTNRFNLYRSAEISGAPAAGYSADQAMQALEEVAKATMPPDIGFQWSNMSYQEKTAQGKGSLVFVMALVFVFLILAAQYESWKLPVAVLMGTPWVVLGAMTGLFIARLFSESYLNNVFAQIGLVMLIGLNAKNAILIVEFAKTRMEEGAGVVDAAIGGARLRFRPILMTSFAFILGVMPLVVAHGAGAEARKVMGMTVLCGMVTATVLGCVLIPSFFVLVAGRRRMPKTGLVLVPVLLVCVMLSGCSVGGRWSRPAAPASGAFHEPVRTDTTLMKRTDTTALMEWWKLYQDTALVQMIRTTLDSNRDLLTAAARIGEARAQAAISKAAIYPRLDYQLQAGGGRAGDNARKVSGGTDGGVLNGYVVLGWEVDLWGKLRGSRRSAVASFLSVSYNRSALQVSLVAEVASQYFLLRDLDNRLEIAQRTLEGRKIQTRILSERFEKGYIPELDKLQAIQQEADIAAAVPDLERQIVGTENALRLLMGQGPGPVPRGKSNFGQTLSPDIPVDLSSGLLQRRPDVLSAEMGLRAQFEQIGVAQAYRLPTFSLTGMLGLASPQLSSFVSGQSFVANGLGALTGPIFHFSQLKNQVRVERQKTEQALYQYQQTVLGAYQDVDNALTYLRTYSEEYAQRHRQTEAAVQAQRLSDARYDRGFTSFLEVLVQQENLFTAQMQESAAMQGKLNSIVMLYKSLGGGW